MARALWKGAISFGLVTIPVSLYPAKDAQSEVAFHLLHEGDLSRIHNRRVDEENHEVPYEEVVKGYEYEKDRYVVVSDAEIKAANVEATQTIEILHFVDSRKIDLAYFDVPYYTEPTKMGRKAYALLRKTLHTTGKVGVAKMVIRERQHLCVVMADGLALLAYTLRWPYQLRDASELNLPGADLDELGVGPEDLKMAELLVEAMTSEWRPDQYKDTFRDDLLALIEKKAKEGEMAQPPAPTRESAHDDKVVDITALLRQSLDRSVAKPRSGRSAPS
jgi:DNA end-binding protein Ku